MSSTAPSPAVPPPAEAVERDEKAARAKARRRAAVCPGAGWALLGCPRRGALVLAAVSISLATLIWLVWSLSPASMWAAGIATLLAAVLWTVEWLDTGWCLARPPAESPLVRRFGLIACLVWCAGLAIPPLIAVRFGSIEISDDRMAPEIEPGERLIYHRRAAEADLKRGAVILYRLSPQAKGGTAGELVVARILAAPGDEISLQGGHYLVNGQTSRSRAPVAAARAPLSVPSHPKTLTVPERRYFVVQDSPATGIDSQQLSWARQVDLVSTRLFHFVGRGLPRPVE